MYHSLSQWQQDRQAACAASPPEKCNYFLLLSWWWCNTTMGEVHLVVDDNNGLTNTLTLSTTDQWLHPQIRTTAIGKNNWLYEMTSYRALLRKEYKFMDLIDCIVKYWCTVLINYVRNNAILFESTKSCLTYNQKQHLKQLRKWPYKKRQLYA